MRVTRHINLLLLVIIALDFSVTFGVNIPLSNKEEFGPQNKDISVPESLELEKSQDRHSGSLDQNTAEKELATQYEDPQNVANVTYEETSEKIKKIIGHLMETSLPDEELAGCPRGFVPHPSIRKCYALINSHGTYDFHSEICNYMTPNSHLAAPLNAAEDNFIQSLIVGSFEKYNCQWFDDVHKVDFYGYFLGAQSCERKLCGTFQWHLAGDMRQKMNYKNFSPGQPNCASGGREFCLQYRYNLMWNDVPCDWKFCAVCEYRL